MRPEEHCPLAEAEFQNGLFREALGHETKAVELARSVEEPQLYELEERLKKIREAAK